MVRIGYYRGVPPFGRRIVAPFYEAKGQLIGHLGRAVDDGVTPSYLFQRRSELLFNLYRVKNATDARLR